MLKIFKILAVSLVEPPISYHAGIDRCGEDTRIDPDRFVEYELLKEIHRALFSGAFDRFFRWCSSSFLDLSSMPGTQMIFGHRVTDSRSFFRAIDRDHSRRT